MVEGAADRIQKRRRARTPLAVSRPQSTSAGDYASVWPAVQGGCRSRGAAQDGLAPSASPQLCDPSARARRGHSRDFKRCSDIPSPRRQPATVAWRSDRSPRSRAPWRACARRAAGVRSETVRSRRRRSAAGHTPPGSEYTAFSADVWGTLKSPAIIPTARFVRRQVTHPLSKKLALDTPDPLATLGR